MGPCRLDARVGQAHADARRPGRDAVVDGELRSAWRLRPLAAYSVEKLFSRTCARNSRPIEPSRIVRRGRPRNSVLRAAAGDLTSASTMCRVNCETHYATQEIGTSAK